MKFDIVTIFPEIVEPYLSASILGRGQEGGAIEISTHNLRDWTSDKHNTVDDTPYGGGPGMIMKVEPFDKAVEALRESDKKTRIVLTSARGKQFTQCDAERLSDYDQVIFLCGRYEGVDARVEEHIADELLSIGDYVLTGGELPAMVMTDAIARLVPGVLGKQASLDTESHSEKGYLEYPQYTKPREYNGWKVPDILLSGDHGAVDAWRVSQATRQADEPNE